MALKKFKNKRNVPKTRKQLRKEERKNKKIRRNEYYTNRRKPGQYVLLKNRKSEENFNEDISDKRKPLRKEEPKSPPVKTKNKSITEEMSEKEKRQQKKLQKEMQKQRKKQLVVANLEEDRNIKQLEKQLKLNKRKSKSVPTSFRNDGLDYLLEVCDPENLKNSAVAEQQLTEINEDLEEDFILMTGSKSVRETKDDAFSDSDSLSFDSASNDDMASDVDENTEENINSDENLEEDDDEEEEEEEEEEDDDDEEEEEEEEMNIRNEERTNKEEKYSRMRRKRNSLDSVSSDESSNDQNEKKSAKKNNKKRKRESISGSDSEDQNENSDLDANSSDDLKDKHDGTWEDIYGRLHGPDGSIISAKTDKYVPPAARTLKENTSEDKSRIQKLEKLKKQLKGLINKLAESNMHSIATQIEELYMSNSRNDMNNTITNLIFDALVSNILAPERLLMEHVLLIVILHANVGTEVGAHFLQSAVKKFDEMLKSQNVENKILDNIVIILAQLYNFRLFDSKLIYEVVDKLSETFGEKEVECILHVLKNVGFSMRKDNPIALKNLILGLQKKASNVSDRLKDNSRVKFMLDILLAIKNNNVTKIPNYDTTYSEHLKKIMKGFIRKGNYVTQLNISLDDLLKAEEKGKWWVVGSAWTGNAVDNENVKKPPEKVDSFSQKLLDLAAKQRMNTDARKNIFCIIMSAEDYLDAFEKLLRLALKNQQEREIIHVILHCCLQEKTYNPYYAMLAQKFCEYDRKYQITIKYSIWDKLKALRDHSATQISNLAKLLSHVFLEKGLPISTLKIVQFSELDKVTLRFIRQILLGILLHQDLEACKEVFEKVSQSEKLKMFRESLKLFLYHFLLRNLDAQGISEDKKELLQQRVRVVEKVLTGRETKFRF